MQATDCARRSVQPWIRNTATSRCRPVRSPWSRKAAAARKPIVVAKIGRTEVGRRAAASHTASLVGADAAYSAAFKQLGIIRVDDVDDMLDLAAYFSVGRLPRGRNVAGVAASRG